MVSEVVALINALNDTNKVLQQLANNQLTDKSTIEKRIKDNRVIMRSVIESEAQNE